MDRRHLLLSFDEDDCFRIPLDDVHEIIALEGPFKDLNVEAESVAVRQRTVRMVPAPRPPVGRSTLPRKLVVFERGHRLHGLVVSRAELQSTAAAHPDTGVGEYRELNLNGICTP